MYIQLLIIVFIVFNVLLFLFQNVLWSTVKRTTYLGTVPIPTIEKAIQSNAIPFVFTIDRRLALGIVAFENRSDVLAQPIFTEKQMFEIGTHIVILT